MEWININDKEPVLTQYIVFISEDQVWSGMYQTNKEALTFEAMNIKKFELWMPLMLTFSALHFPIPMAFDSHHSLKRYDA